jgi:hypothetical protein
MDNIVNKEFQVHLLNEKGIEAARSVASIFDNTLIVLGAHCPSGREWSIVKTKLEEACFFAKKALANDVGNQRSEG